MSTVHHFNWKGRKSSNYPTLLNTILNSQEFTGIHRIGQNTLFLRKILLAVFTTWIYFGNKSVTAEILWWSTQNSIQASSEKQSIDWYIPLSSVNRCPSACHLFEDSESRYRATLRSWCKCLCCISHHCSFAMSHNMHNCIQ